MEKVKCDEFDHLRQVKLKFDRIVKRCNVSEGTDAFIESFRKDHCRFDRWYDSPIKLDAVGILMVCHRFNLDFEKIALAFSEIDSFDAVDAVENPYPVE